MERGFFTRNFVCFVASFALHAACVAALVWTTRVPSLGFRFHMPSEVEFGLAEPTGKPASLGQPQAALAAPPQAEPIEAKTGDGRDWKAHRTPRKASINRPSRVTEQPASTTAAPSTQSSVAAIANAEQGAYLALRVDMMRVRTSEFAEDVRGLLGAIPDWQMLLRGSEIDPVRDLDRLLIASPNFRRANVVIAGKHPLGRAEVEKIAEKMSGAHGRTATWQEVNGIPQAPWIADDNTERSLAMVGGKEFVIARNEDIPRVLSVAAVRAARGADAGVGATSLIDGLLKIDEPVVVELEVEGAKRYVLGGQRGIPESLKASIKQPVKAGVPVMIKATYESSLAAKDAAEYWSSVRDHYAALPMVAMLGLSSLLSSVTFEPKGKQLTIEAHMTLSQVHIILGYIRSYLESPGQ